MRIAWYILLVLAALVALGSHLALRDKAARSDNSRPRPPVYSPDQVAANGVVEGARPEAALRPETPGVLAVLHYRENADVARGTVLAELSNEPQVQQVALAAAEVDVARAELDRLRNGERAEKRKAAAALESAKRAVHELAKTDFERSQKLAGTPAVTTEKRDLDRYRMLHAQAEMEQAAAERALIEAPARADEEAAAEGRVRAAEARLRLAKAELGKTYLKAPFAGRVLRVFAEPGEMAGPASPQPLLVMADLSKRRVRAFVEELDAPRVEAGQPAVVTVDGLPDREFAGRVTEVLPRMGKRTVLTDFPEEYKDLYFREVLIDLEAGEELIVNLRVKVRIQVR
jgi:multidrug resistance efflux pump